MSEVDSRVWIGTSWKMTKTQAEARAFARALAAAEVPAGVQPFVVPPFTAISVVRDELPRGGPVLVGAQNTHWDDDGAWTGEISPRQLADLGCDLVEVGHSERREHFGETDQTVNLKIKAIRRHGMRPLVCFGEPWEVREAGRAGDYVRHQVDAALAGVDDPDDVLLAYEPIWAIGEHGRPATPADVAPALAPLLSDWGGKVGAVLYGGSVHPANAADLLDVEGIDGLFIGRAAWNPAGFLSILGIAAESRAA